MSKSLFFLFALCLNLSVKAQLTIVFKNKQLPTKITLAELCKSEPLLIEQFFNQINLNSPGLEKAKQAVQIRDWTKASKMMVDYYKSKPKNNWLIATTSNLDSNTFQIAEDVLNDNYTFQDVKGKLPRLANGKRDWYHNGPKHDAEWAWFLNRHLFFADIYNAYRKKDNPEYAVLLNSLITDWVLSNPVYPGLQNNFTWRPLETGIRVGRSWVKLFYDLQNVPEFTDAARLLMLISIYDHADYLNKFHGKHHNHAVSELMSLAKVSLNFAEFKNSDMWYRTAVKNMEEEFRYSAYPDGASKELTNHYQLVIAREFGEFIELNNQFQKELPPFFDQIVEGLYNHAIYTTRPDGFGLLNNDSDLRNNFEIIKNVNSRYKRADWDYIFSNGKTGTAPKETSVIFPWAGHFIMRNGYGEQSGKDHFAYFDVGPWGTTHQHNDKLHLSLYAYGREFLCDNGRMYYKGDSLKSYVNLSVGHNVIALDEKGQNETIMENKSPIEKVSYDIQPEADFAISTYADGFGDKSRNAKSYSINKTDENITGKHTRAVIYLKNRYWIVVDQIEADKPRNLTAFWHFNPNCDVKSIGSTVQTADAGKSNLAIYPVGNSPWNVSLIKGQYSPYVQGWYSDIYNHRIPAYCAEYRLQAKKNVETFAWVMYPSKDNKFKALNTRVLESSAGTFRFKVNIEGETQLEVAINMQQITSVKLSDKSTFTGRCVVVQKGKSPIVIQGKLTDKRGRILLEKE